MLVPNLYTIHTPNDRTIKFEIDNIIIPIPNKNFLR